MSKRPPGPGPTKVRRVPLVRCRSVELLQGWDHRWSELFETADVMSEGAVRREPEGLTYYGSTSLLLGLTSTGGRVPDGEAARVARVLCADPHARLRLVRLACREARLRSNGPLGCVSTEVFVRTERRGIRLDVEVEALVLEDSADRTTRSVATASVGRIRAGGRRASSLR